MKKNCDSLIWTLLNLEKKKIFDPPHFLSKLGTIRKTHNFEIDAPPLALTKTVPKLYLTYTSGLLHSYISHIGPNVT